MKIRNIGIISGLVIAILVASFSAPYPVIVDDEPTGSWHVIWQGGFMELMQAAEGNPGSGVSGILEIYFANHSATGSETYTVNTTAVIEGWCTAAGLAYSGTDDFNLEIKHSTKFDIVVRGRANKTVCANSTESYGVYNLGRLRVNITCMDLGIPASTTMSILATRNATTEGFIWFNAYVNNSNVGYEIAAGNTTTLPEIKFEAYY
jgi:hypothetical protein